MKTEQILQLVEAVSASELTEFKYESDGVKLSLKKANTSAGQEPILQAQTPVMHTAMVQTPMIQPSVAQMPVVQSQVMPKMEMPTVQPGESSAGASQGEGALEKSAQDSSLSGAQEKSGGQVVKSPLVGTFYAAPSEDADTYVKVGDPVKEGQVLAIVEAMKLMNEIESDYTGTIAEILVENGQAVEYGQPLFVIR